MLSRLRPVRIIVPERLRRARRGDRGSYTTELVIGITIVVAITAVVGPILTDTFAQAAQSIDLGVDE